MTFEEWAKSYMSGMLYDGDAESKLMWHAAHDAWKAAQPQWPEANERTRALGWTFDYDFLDEVEKIAGSRTEYSTSVEATEQVLIAALEVLGRRKKPQPSEVGS